MIIIQKIQNDLEKYSLHELATQIGVSDGTIRDLLFNPKRKYRPQILDKIYSFYKLEKDNFYKQKKYNQYKSLNLIGEFFRKKRLAKKLSLKQVAKQIKGSDRHLARIEAGRINFVKNAYYIKTLQDFYNLSEKEKEILNKNIKALKELYDLTKNVIE